MRRPESEPVAGARFPDPLVEGARSVLRQYGYRHLAGGETRDDWADMWLLLRSDFANVHKQAVPTFDAMAPAVQEAARTYMQLRLVSDHRLDVCRDAHAALFRDGIEVDRVEAYAEAREAYEDSVEAFGAARESVDALLRRVAER